jgi:arginyl-tRNA synthetase
VNIGQGLKTNVEFVSINPTGPIHVGHGRNAVFGDAICRLLERTGYDVYREYLLNDAGNQIKGLVLSVHARYRELFGQPLELPEDGYVGEYIIDIAAELKARDGDKWLNIDDSKTLFTELREFCVKSCMDLIMDDVHRLGIKFDLLFSEHQMHQDGNPVQQVIDILKDKGAAAYEALPPPKGKEVSDYQAEPLWLFKATNFGQNQDKPILNRHGEPTYFGQDIAYEWNKLKRGFKWLIVVVAKQQMGMFEPNKLALKALTDQYDMLSPVYYELVKVLRDGAPVKLSKRAGNIVALKDVLDEVGPEVYRFWMLTRRPETELIFDLAKAVEQSNDNPVFYVQYAHARLCAVQRQWQELGNTLEAPADADLRFLTSPHECTVMQLLERYPLELKTAAKLLEPHRMVFYMQDLAKSIHAWYGAEKFIQPNNPALTQARLVLAEAAKNVLADALNLVGVRAPEQM